MDEREQRAGEIRDSIREVLLRNWDPVGINEIPEAQDEYDSYVGMIYRLLAAGSSEDEIFRHLSNIQANTMGIPVNAKSHLRNVANKLMQLDVSLQS